MSSKAPALDMRNFDFPYRKLAIQLLFLYQLWLLFIKYVPWIGHSTECHTNTVRVNTHNKPTNLVQIHNPISETLGQDAFLNSELLRCRKYVAHSLGYERLCIKEREGLRATTRIVRH